MHFKPLLSLPFLSLLLASCDAPEQAAYTPPPPLVKTVTLQPEEVSISREYPGRLVPIRLAEVRARVSGIVLSRNFVQGGDVKQGDVLFEIDPAKFMAAVESAKAQLARTEAALSLAAQQSDRTDRLLKTNVATNDQADIAIANRKQAEAEVAVAKANVRDAELELGYASVRSPINGRIGPALVTEGTLVRQEDGTQMATIRDRSSVYVDFTDSLTELFRLQGEVANGTLTASDTQGAVQLIMDDGSNYGHEGRLLFSSADVNETTGQVTLRAEFSNPDGRLLPGTYVRVRMTEGIAQKALVVPQRAVQWNTLGQAQVVVVKDGKAALQPITTGRSLDNRWLVTAGLKPGDQVIVDGVERAMPGGSVTAEAAVDQKIDAAKGSDQLSCGDVCEKPSKI